jgi:hypothetical protein
MAVNKKALVRYLAYDKCLSNPYKKYGWEDLLEEANEALYEEGVEGIGRSMFFEDIKFMEMCEWKAPIEKYKEGRRVFYRYDDPEYSISAQTLNQEEKEHLKDAISVLSRFRGVPQFDWLNNMIPELEIKLGMINTERELMSFDSNEQYTGNQWIPQLYKALVHRNALQIEYLPFSKEKTVSYIFHIAFMKQYNGRWHAYGINEQEGNPIWNIALDRIHTLEVARSKYIESETDWEAYFKPIIGFTRPDGIEPKKHTLSINEEDWPYVATKPLHHSQRKVEVKDGKVVFTVDLIDNYEFRSKVAAYRGKMEVIEE